VFEEFLYCRELPVGDLVLLPRGDKVSKKQKVDLEILQKFGQIHF
jgi:hypothetical protein